jgi:hypothetical protein
MRAMATYLTEVRIWKSASTELSVSGMLHLWSLFSIFPARWQDKAERGGDLILFFFFALALRIFNTTSNSRPVDEETPHGGKQQTMLG